jgi:hypothetical protein
MLDVTRLKTNTRAHIVLDAIEYLGAAKIFSPSVLVGHQWVATSIASRGDCRYTSGPVTPKLHEHSSDHV